MRMLKHRCCEICRATADLSQTSAHYCRVMWFCALHGRVFHALEFAWRGSTAEILARIDLWLSVKREAFTASGAVA